MPIDATLVTDTGRRRLSGGQVRLNRSSPALRTIAALVMREMTTRFGRTPGGFIWAILQPLATIIVLGVAFSMLSKTPALGTSYLFFKATGLLSFQTFRNTSTTVGKSLSYSSALLVYPSVTWGDAILARFILNTLVNALVATLILTGLVLALHLSLIIHWGLILLSMALASGLGFGIGVLNCYLFERVAIWSNVWSILNAPLMILSGVVLLYESLPTVAQEIIWYNPVIHITGLMRAGFYSTYQPTYISVPYVLVWMLIPMVMGLLLVRRYHRQLLNH
ncbi:MAG: ABC transporter permease [Rhodobacteraceae bacterium]|nr:ABC transporter permease [Paracoccaceae bacterium]